MAEKETPDPAARPLNILERINAIQQEVTYLQKDGRVKVKTKQGGEFEYPAVTHDAVVAALRQHLVERGVVIVTEPVEHEFRADFKMTLLRVRVSFRCMDTFPEPGSTLDVEVYGYGQDLGDKGPGKALSYAVKYALLKTFLLETGESDESRAQVDRPMDADQYRQLTDLMQETDSDEKTLLDYLVSKNLIQPIKRLSELPQPQFPVVRAALIAKRKKLQEADSERSGE